MLLALVLLAGSARGESADAVARARTHFEAGRALYNLGNYTDAVREFSAGYQLVPKPQFLINLGQSFRKLDDLPHARDMYKKFLVEAAPNDPDREQVKSILADIERQIASRPVTPPPPEKPEPTPTASPEPQPAAVAQPLPTEGRRKSFIARHWWIIPVSVVAAAGLSVGIYFAVKPSGQVDCAAATLGCIPANMALLEFR
jgi:hypothetical protein